MWPGSDFASLPRLAHSENQASSDKSARLEALLIDPWRFRGLPLVESFGSSGARLRRAYGAAGPRPTKDGPPPPSSWILAPGSSSDQRLIGPEHESLNEAQRVCSASFFDMKHQFSFAADHEDLA